MKKLIKFAVILLTTGLLLHGCKDDDDDTAPKGVVIFNFNATMSGNKLAFGETYTDFLGRSTQIELFKYYISNIEFVDANNNLTYVKDVALIDFMDEKQSFAVLAETGAYTGIRLGIGIDAVQNASDPSTFKDTHPLSTRQNTYWDWAAKYRFLMVDGRSDTDGDGTFNRIFSYHTGLDTMYRIATYEHYFKVDNQNNVTLNFAIDINDIFSKVATVDCAFDSSSSWHGETATAEIAARIMDNAVAALNVK